MLGPAISRRFWRQLQPAEFYWPGTRFLLCVVTTPALMAACWSTWTQMYFFGPTAGTHAEAQAQAGCVRPVRRQVWRRRRAVRRLCVRQQGRSRLPARLRMHPHQRVVRIAAFSTSLRTSSCRPQKPGSCADAAWQAGRSTDAAGSCSACMASELCIVYCQARWHAPIAPTAAIIPLRVASALHCSGMLQQCP